MRCRMGTGMGVIATTVPQEWFVVKLYHLWNCSKPRKLKHAPLEMTTHRVRNNSLYG
jgi:hypothetical protein